MYKTGFYHPQYHVLTRKVFGWDGNNKGGQCQLFKSIQYEYDICRYLAFFLHALALATFNDSISPKYLTSEYMILRVVKASFVTSSVVLFRFETRPPILQGHLSHVLRPWMLDWGMLYSWLYVVVPPEIGAFCKRVKKNPNAKNMKAPSSNLKFAMIFSFWLIFEVWKGAIFGKGTLRWKLV